MSPPARILSIASAGIASHTRTFRDAPSTSWPQQPVEDREEPADLPFLGVAHVGDAEGLLLEIAVTVRDGRPLLRELLVEPRDRNAPRVADARERRRLVPLLREDREAAARPVAHDAREALVALVPGRQPLGEDVVELGVESLDLRDRRRRRGLAALVVLHHVEEVEVVPASRDRLGLVERPRRDRRDGQPGGESERLLEAGE